MIDAVSLQRYNIVKNTMSLQRYQMRSDMILYHGSEHIIEKPQLSKGKLHNDYGRGFYCTQNEELAMEWACAAKTDGFANKYEFDDTGLKILDLNAPEYNILNWLAVLVMHRTYWQKGSIAEEAKRYIADNFTIDIGPYDVIKGYRADDSFFTFAQDFVSGAISLGKLKEAMRLGELGEQIVLKSEAAFERLKYSESKAANAAEYYRKKYERDLAARRKYRNVRSASVSKDDIFILDILREEMKNDDPRLR